MTSLLIRKIGMVTIACSAVLYYAGTTLAQEDSRASLTRLKCLSSKGNYKGEATYSFKTPLQQGSKIYRNFKNIYDHGSEALSDETLMVRFVGQTVVVAADQYGDDTVFINTKVPNNPGVVATVSISGIWGFCDQAN